MHLGLYLARCGVSLLKDDWDAWPRRRRASVLNDRCIASRRAVRNETDDQRISAAVNAANAAAEAGAAANRPPARVEAMRILCEAPPVDPPRMKTPPCFRYVANTLPTTCNQQNDDLVTSISLSKFQRARVPLRRGNLAMDSPPNARLQRERARAEAALRELGAGFSHEDGGGLFSSDLFVEDNLSTFAEDCTLKVRARGSILCTSTSVQAAYQ